MVNHSVIIDDGSKFQIVPATRKIIVPSGYNVIGTVNDHNSEQITFQCPKTVDGHEIMNCAVKRVIWKNANDKKGKTDFTEITSDEEYVYLKWTISSEITAAAGNVSIVVQFEDKRADGVTSYRWSTTECKDCRVLDTLSADDAEDIIVPEGYIKPEGTTVITSNGTHDVTAFAAAEVNVLGEETKLQEKMVNINENGTTEVKADTGYDGLSKVIINAKVHQNFCSVKFYNDDRTTLLYEVLVPYGSNAVYAGEAPTSTQTEGTWIFSHFEPAAANIMEDLNCYAIYEEKPELNNMTWEEISAISAEGTGADYFAVGDTKAVTVNGTVGTATINETLYVYIIGFDHNGELEGTGIHFGTFKTADGTDVALADSKTIEFAYSADGTKYFNIYHSSPSSNTENGWQNSDMRYDILGSVDVKGAQNAGETTATSPVANTLMAALPTELRSVMKPMTKYTNNTGSKEDNAEWVTATTEYLPLLAEYEIFGRRISAIPSEQTKQKQYAYFAAGNSTSKYPHTNLNQTVYWWTRSPAYSTYSTHNVYVTKTSTNGNSSGYSCGIAPIFKV